MKIKLLIPSILLLPIFFYGQIDSSFYYYNDIKIPITKNHEYISVILTTSDISTISQDATLKNYILSIENPQLDNTNNYISSISNNNISYYTEVHLTDLVRDNQFVFFNVVNSLKRKNDISFVASTYKTKEGKRLGLTNKFYVKLRNADDEKLLNNFAQNYNVVVRGNDPYMPLWYVVECSKSNTYNSLELANIFYETGNFAYCEPAFAYHDLQATNDPYYYNQWNIENTGQYDGIPNIDINANQAWAITKGANVQVAIYDHGFDRTHPDLQANNYGNGFDASTGTTPAQIRGPHGTACAGIVGAVQNNNIGITGVSPETNLVSISIELLLSDTPIQLASGFSWAWNNGIDVISNSWGGYAPSNILTDAINDALHFGRGGKGCVIVFASGNDLSDNGNDEGINYPGNAIDDILVVGAIGPCAERINFGNCSDNQDNWASCYGTKLDLVAPGIHISTTDIQGDDGYYTLDYIQIDGTSAACPHVAGVAALILSVNPCLSTQQVNDIIEKTARKVGSYTYINTSDRPNGTWNNEMGYGLVDAYAAVQMAQSMYLGTLDLMIKDVPEDLGLEPNTYADQPWRSTDIWVRNQNDGIDEHQNPEYDPDDPNYVYVRVTNKSCVPSTGNGNDKLILYWSKANTSLTWPLHWEGSLYEQGVLMGEPIDTLDIPALQPGEETILVYEWNVPNPQDYVGMNSNPWHFCLLARIESVDDPIGPDITFLSDYVLENNNAAWKNTTVVDVQPNRPIGGVIAVGNPFHNPKSFNLEFIPQADEPGTPIFKEAEVKIDMEPVLYKAWNDGGKSMNDLRKGKEDNIKIVTGENAVLKNIKFDANETGTMYLSFNFLTEEVTGKDFFVYHVIQRETETNKIIGGETYEIHKNPRNLFLASTSQPTIQNDTLTYIANSIGEPAMYNWYDPNGNLIASGTHLTLDANFFGDYKLEVIADADGYKDYKEIEIANPFSIEGLTPNPAANQVSVKYEVGIGNSAYLTITNISSTISNNYILDELANEIILDVSGYTAGIYVVSLVCNGQIVDSENLIKQ